MITKMCYIYSVERRPTCERCFYGIVKRQYHYDDAVKYCEETGGELANFASMDEYEQALQYAQLDNPIFSVITSRSILWTSMLYNALDVSLQCNTGYLTSQGENVG